MQTKSKLNVGLAVTSVLIFAVICFLQPRAVSAQWTTDGNGHMSNTNTGNVGIGTTPGTSLDVAGNILNLGSESGTKNRGNNTIKFARLAMPPYVTSNMRFALLGGATTSTANIVALGGEVGGMSAATQIDFFTASSTNVDTGTLRMTINGSGKVGVGLNLPTAQFHILAPDGEALRLYRNVNNSGWGVGQFFALNNSSGVSTDYAQISGGVLTNTAGAENGALAFYTRGAGTLAERMRITDAGVVGIGTLTPGTTYRLNVQGGTINSSDGLCIAGNCIANWSAVASPWLGSGSIYYNTGNVGIGTSALPTRKLEVVGGNVFHQFSTTAGSEHGFYTALNNNHFTSNLYYDGQWKMIATGKGAVIATGPNSGNAFAVYSDNTARSANAAATLTQLVAVTMDGKMGIGTTSTPAEKLEVNGNLKVSGTGNITATGTIEGNNVKAKYQDVAEWVDSSQELPAATVVVLDSNKSNQVIASTQAYDSRVAGVISLRPGVALGEEGEGRVLVATTGRVKVKVDATNGPIQIGDLLVTSEKTGLAMKSVPVEIGGVRLHRPGTLIGKALEPLAQGTGEILVLLSLQ